MGLALTIDEIKQYLRVDTNDNDAYITGLIPLAQEYCENYMRKPIPEAAPPGIKQAALLLIGYFYENRDGGGDGVPQAVHTLLAPYRETSW